jgi:hypothetical protein
MFFKSHLVPRIAALAVTCLTWYALYLQFQLAPGFLTTKGTILQDTLIRFFSYFAVITNFYVAVATSYVVVRPFREPASPSFLGSLALYTAALPILYSLIQGQPWTPQGTSLRTEQLFHYAVPFAFFVFWLIAVQKGRLTFGHSIGWLAYPALFLIGIVYLGLEKGIYPYSFLDARIHDRKQIFINADIILAAFVALGIVVVAIDRVLGRWSPEEEDD